MIRLFCAVADDLLTFFTDFLSGLLFGRPNAIKRLSAPEARPLLREREYVPLITSRASGGGSAVEVPSELRTLKKHSIMYTSSVATPLRSAPGAFGDTVYAVLPYGSMVMVMDQKDLWAEIMHSDHRGWVYIDDLLDSAGEVYPSFIIGTAYSAEDPQTIRLRAIINDEFGAGEMGLPLQSEEYVLYRLLRKGVRIMWPPVRPRTPGTWKDILGSVPGVIRSSVPAVGAVVEFTYGEEGRGHVAYVDAVFADSSIQVSEANWPEDGRYNERVLTQAEWALDHIVFLIF